MGFKTIEEMVKNIKEYGNNFCASIPEKFTVHIDYLIDGMTEQSFCEGYRAYQKKMQALQEDMSRRPEDFGLIAYDKKGSPKPAYSMVNQYIWLFLALGQSGKIENGSLKIDGIVFESFCTGKKSVGKNETSPKNIDKLLDRLEDHGFTVSKESGGDFTITSVTSDTMYLMQVIKSSTLSPYARTSMTSDYPAFNWRMYKYGIDEKLPLEETYTYNAIMSETQKEFSSKLLSELAQNGWKSYIFFPHNMYGFRLTFPTLEYYYGWDGGFILIRNEKQTLKLKAYMESLPEKYGTLWESATKCRGCRKGDCNSRIAGEMFFGKKAALCKSSKVRYSCEIEDIPYIVEAAMITAGKKQI